MAKHKTNKLVYLQFLVVLVSLLVVIVAIVLSTSEDELVPVAPGPPGYLYEISEGEVA